MAGARIASLTHEQLQDPGTQIPMDGGGDPQGNPHGGEPSLVQASHPQAPQRPQTSQGYDATRSVAPAETDEHGSIYGAKKPAGDPALISLAGSAAGAVPVGAIFGGPAAVATGIGSEAFVRAGEGVARDMYHETDNSPEAAQRAQSRIRK